MWTQKKFIQMMEKIETQYQELSDEVRKNHPKSKVTVRISELIKKRIKGFKKRLTCKRKK